jgi:hypothetical protein
VCDADEEQERGVWSRLPMWMPKPELFTLPPPDCMSRADQNLSKFQGHPRIRIILALEETGASRFWAIEMRRNEPQSKWPSPYNDVITTTTAPRMGCRLNLISTRSPTCSRRADPEVRSSFCWNQLILARQQNDPEYQGG